MCVGPNVQLVYTGSFSSISHCSGIHCCTTISKVDDASLKSGNSDPDSLDKFWTQFILYSNAFTLFLHF